MSITRRYYKTLPRWGKRLSRRFVAAYGKPAGLWLPNDVVNKAYDFSSNRNIGTLNGGITTTASGWGVLGAAWKCAPANQFSSTSFSLSTAALVGLGSVAFPDFTVAWIGGIGTGSSWENVILLHHSGTFGNQLKLTLNATSITFNYDSNYTLSFTPPASTAFYVFVKKGTTATVYVNCASVATATVGASITGDDTQAKSFYQFFSNTPDNLFYFSVFSKGFTVGQISSLYQALRTGDPYPLFEPQTVRRGYGIRSIVGGSSFRFRRTLSDYGTRVGSRQAIG